MAEPTLAIGLTDLPLDILLLIVPYLSPSELLSFSSITPTFYSEPDLRYAASYWRAATRDTFRVPNHPVVEGDGRRWMRMYRKMRAQTTIYGWGNDDGGCMNTRAPAHGATAAVGGPRRRFRGRVIGGGPVRPLAPGVEHVGTPEVLQKGEAAVVADLQCGGWSTTILDSRGALHTSGHIDGGQTNWRYDSKHERSRLKYPPGYTPPTSDQHYDAYTAIKQFSSGRSHVLGLSDAGRIWTWDHVESVGLHVKFMNIDLVESASQDLSKKKGYVRKVVAGWSRSTAYIVGTGIVTWEPSNTAEIESISEQTGADGMLVLESWVVPDSHHVQPSAGIKSDVSDRAANAEEIGEVVSYAVLEAYVLFVTHIGKVFACHTRNNELRTFQLTPRNSPNVDENTFAIDVQGSHRSFAILKRNGEVLTGNDTYLSDMENNFNKLHKIPSLQNTGVISMAFGDYHYHALHSDGTITSYGNDPQGCGALGFGVRRDRTMMLRGMKRNGQMSPDFSLINGCYTTGRRVWFEPEKRLWLQSLVSTANSPGSVQRMEICTSRHDVCAEVSEWVEQKLLQWEDGADNRDDGADEDELPAYFALSVAAAGWHSGALVLVDKEKAQRIAAKYREAPSPSPPSPPQAQAESPETTQPSPDTTTTTTTDTAPLSDAATTSLISNTMSAVRSGVNWCLGTPPPGLRTAGSGPLRQSPTPPAATTTRWIWEGQGFPRLRLRSGEVLVGGEEEEVVGWTGPEAWGLVGECVE